MVARFALPDNDGFSMAFGGRRMWNDVCLRSVAKLLGNASPALIGQIGQNSEKPRRERLFRLSVIRRPCGKQSGNPAS